MKTIAKFEKVSLEQWLADGGREEDYDKIKLPKRATKGSAGYDFFTPRELKLSPCASTKFPTGIRCKIEDGYDLELYPRSGLGFKHRISLNNTVGIIDSDYYYANNEGHIMCKLYNPNTDYVIVNKDEAFMQGIFREIYYAEEEIVTEERTGGFGSTTRKA